MKKVFKNAVCLCMVLVLTYSVFAAALPALAADKEPLHNEKDFYDFSEMNMITGLSNLASDVYYRDYGDGGNWLMAANYLSSWAGPVDEALHPYETYYNENAEYKKLPNNLYIDDVLFIPNDLNTIKTNLMEYGALYCSYIYYDSQLDNYTSFYNPVGYEPTPDDDIGSHAVTLIGWDDNYSRDNFKIKPETDGAIICKNSWGTYSGDDGYIYISYCDNIFSLASSDEFAAFTAADSDCGYNKIYQYDEFGLQSSVSSLYSNIDYAANVFPEEGKALESDEILKAVSFYTIRSFSRYNVYLVKNYKTPNDLKTSIFNRKAVKIASGSMTFPGYHVIDLEKEYVLEKGSRYGIIVEIDDNILGQAQYGCEEAASKDIKANKGESFYCADNLIIDLTDSIKNTNWCIKAFTQYKPGSQAGNSPEALGKIKYFGVDNKNRKYESDVSYSFEELVDFGFNINSEYIDYMTNPDGRAIVPAPILFNKDNTNSLISNNLPAKYDLRDYGLVSTVKNQGALGSCWAHAAIGSLESNALKKYPSGNGVFESAKVLKTRNEQSANISAAGDKVVYKFTAPKSAEYTFTVSGDKAKGELCTAFGIVVEKSNSLIKRYMAKGETLYLRAGFADSKTTGKITVKADTQYLYDKSLAVEIVAGTNVTNVAKNDEYDIYKIIYEDEFSGVLNITCDEELKILLNGREIPTNEDVDLDLWGEECWLEIISASDNKPEYEIRTTPQNYLITNIYTQIEITENTPYISTGDEEIAVFKFVPEYDDFYDLMPDNYSLRDSEGKAIYDSEDNYKYGHWLLEAGKTYYFLMYDGLENGQSYEIRRWKDSHDSVTELECEKAVFDFLYNKDDNAVYSFTADESSCYELCFSSYYSDSFDISLTDENHTDLGAPEKHFNSGYFYHHLNPGDTIYLTVKQAATDPEFDDYPVDLTGYGYTVSIAKSAVSSFDETLREISEDEVFEADCEDGDELYKFIPKETKTYYFEKKNTLSDPEDYFESYLYIYNSDEEYIDTHSIFSLDYESVYYEVPLTAGEKYFFNFSTYNCDRISLKVLDDETDFVNPDVLTIGSPVKATAFCRGDNNDFILPVMADALEDPYNAYILFTITTTDNIFDSISVEEPYSIQSDDNPVWSDEGQTVTASFRLYVYDEEEGYYSPPPNDKPLNTNLILPSGYEYIISMEYVEYDSDYQYISCDADFLTGGYIAYKGTATMTAYFSDYDGKIIWSSSNEDVAVVDENGKLTATGIGSAVITAQTEDGSKEMTETVNVKYSLWQRIIRIFLLGFFWYK